MRSPLARPSSPRATPARRCTASSPAPIELRKGEQSLGVLEPGDTFGELAIVSEAPRSLTAIATEPSVLAVIDDKAFLFLVHETPTFALQVMRSMADRIRDRDPHS